MLRHLMRGESLTLIGVGSSGKSNVARHLARRDVREYHLGDQARSTAGVLVDFLHYTQADVVGMHSALVTALAEAAARADAPAALAGCRADLLILRRHTAEATTPNLSGPCVTDALRLVYGAGMRQIFFLLDDFDRALQAAPAAALLSLRGFRDSHKGMLSYVAVLRREMAYVRPNIQDYEDFYELVSKPVIPVGAYDWEDAAFMMQVLAGGSAALTPAQCDHVLALSGGHPGLIRHIFGAAEAGKVKLDARDVAAQFAERADARVECDRIWESLAEDEQDAAMALAAGDAIDPQDAGLARLLYKTLAKQQGGQSVLFSPVFNAYALSLAAEAGDAEAGADAASSVPHGRASMTFEQDTHTITLDGRRIHLLDKIAFQLIDCLWKGRNRAVPHRDLKEIVWQHGAASRFRGPPEERLDAYMQELLRRVNLPNRLYIRANADGSYTFLETGDAN
jgi:hypothetical protein